MPASERAKWVKLLPDLAGDWAASLEQRGIPAREFMKQYMEGLRARGEKPVRDWDK
jgi:hypothetical protein